MIKTKKVFALAVVLAIVFTFISMYTVAPVNAATNPVIVDLKGADLTKYANLGKSLDNYGYAQASGKTERTSFTKVSSGTIIFQADKNEYLPGGFIFTTTSGGTTTPGMVIPIPDAYKTTYLNVSYVVNIDPISKDYNSRFWQFEEGTAGNPDLNGALGQVSGPGTVPSYNAWDAMPKDADGKPYSIFKLPVYEGNGFYSWPVSPTVGNALNVPSELLGKDIEIYHNNKVKAGIDGTVKLIAYSCAHYDQFQKNGANAFNGNVGTPGSQAPFKITFKEVKLYVDLAKAPGIYDLSPAPTTPAKTTGTTTTTAKPSGSATPAPSGATPKPGDSSQPAQSDSPTDTTKPITGDATYVILALAIAGASLVTIVSLKKKSAE